MTCDIGVYVVEAVLPVTLRVLAVDADEAREIAAKARFSPLVSSSVLSVSIGFPVEINAHEVDNGTTPKEKGESTCQ